MNPRACFDIEVVGASSHGAGRIPALPVMTRLVRVLHGIFRQYSGRFALGFPRMKSGESRHPGHIIRVFADSRDELDIVVNLLKENERIHGYIRYGYPESVPEGFKGPWKEYRRYRIPGMGSRLDKCRKYRLNASEKLAYFRAASRSNHQGFVLFVECRDGAPSSDCQPDSYGLSVPTRAFSVPMLP